MACQRFLACVLSIVSSTTLTVVLAVAPGPAHVRVDDWNNDGTQDCSGFDLVDDTSCWQNALDAAKTGLQFGLVEATANANYIISDTLVVNSTFGGVIDGHGASLSWRKSEGEEDTLLLLEDTQRLAVRDLTIISGPGGGNPNKPLRCGIEFTNDSGESDVAPSSNVLDHLFIEGMDTGGLQYGVMFSLRGGLDENNDQSTIMNTNINNVTKAAISIEGFNSMQHRFYAVNGLAAAGNGAIENDDFSSESCSPPPDPVCDHLTGASFVRLISGSFTSIGGFHGGFQNAEFYIERAGSPVVIIDSNSEICARFLRSADGHASFSIPVTVLGGRFDITTGLSTDGRIIDWKRYGPLTIRGLHVSGTKPGGVSGDPHFFLDPNSAVVDDYPAIPYQISELTMFTTGSSAWDIFETNANVQLVTHGNMCIDAFDKGAPCSGEAAGVDEFSETVKNKDLSDVSNVFPTTLTADAEWDTTAEINAVTGDDDFATLTGSQVLTNKTITSTTNTFPQTSFVTFSTGATVHTTRYCAPHEAVCDASTEAKVSLELPARMIMKNLRCKASVATGGASKVWTITAQKNGSGSAITCAISGTSSTSCTDTSNSVTYSAGDTLSIKFDATGGANQPADALVQCALGTGP